jgi:hypothetical protein
MWEEQEVVRVDPLPWAVIWGAAWLLPLAVSVVWWNRTQLTGEVVWRAALLWLGVLVIAGVMAWWYNLTVRVHHGFRLWWAQDELQAVDPRRALQVGLVLAPGGALQAWAAALCGVVPSPVPWPWVAWVVLPVVTVLGVAGTAWLYTRVIVAVSELWRARLSAGEAPRVEYVDPNRARTVIGTLVFSWVVALALAAVAGLWLGLLVAAHRLPAGYFGLGVGVFFGFVLAVAGLVGGIVAGIWARALAVLYNRWASAHRGFGLRVVRRTISLEWSGSLEAR